MYTHFRPSNNSQKIKLVVGDLSGTFVDPYSMAPVNAIYDTFKHYGITLSKTKIREGMGLKKKDHIKMILSHNNLMHDLMKIHYDKYNKTTQQIVGSNDFVIDYNIPIDLAYNMPYYIDKIYSLYENTQINTLKNPVYSIPISGVVETLEFLKTKYNIKIGATTGFTHNMTTQIMNNLKEIRLNQNFITISSDQISRSRPYPDGIYKIMDKYKINNLKHVIKIGDTPADMLEGKNAGVWTVGVARYNNKMGEFYENPFLLDKLENNKCFLEKYLLHGYQDLIKHKPHFVIKDFTQLPLVFECINHRLNNYKNPMTIYNGPIIL
jgi:phosphonoacetaldehyde hydrolase